MSKCKICNEKIKGTNDYNNTTYCSIECEIADYIIDEFYEEFKSDKEVSRVIKNYRAKLSSLEIAVTNCVDTTSKHIQEQYEKEVDYQKSLNISLKFFKHDNIFEKLRKSGSLKYYECSYCGDTYKTIDNAVINKFAVDRNTGYCPYTSCREWDIIFKMFYDAFSDSKQHLLVFKSMDAFVKKNQNVTTPDSMRFFEMMSDRGLEAGAFEKKVWNLAADECKANIYRCKVIRHSDSAIERGISNFLKWL